jgi:hypothetical protein
MMGRNKLSPTVRQALLSAGVTEEMIAVTEQNLVSCNTPGPGRPRIHKNRAECDRAYKERVKQRARHCEEIRHCLYEAAKWHAEPGLSVEPIRRLLDKNCDFEADILPIVAYAVPELPWPLRSWGAKWLVQEILAARERRLGLANPPKAQSDCAMASEPDGHGRPNALAGAAARARSGRRSAPRPLRDYGLNLNVLFEIWRRCGR